MMCINPLIEPFPTVTVSHLASVSAPLLSVRHQTLSFPLPPAAADALCTAFVNGMTSFKVRAQLFTVMLIWVCVVTPVLSPPGGHRLAGSPAHRDPDAVWGRDQHRHPHLLLLREHRRWLWADGNFLVRCPTPQGIPRNISRKPRSNSTQIFSDFVEPRNSVKSSHHRSKFNPEVWKISRWHMTWLEL